MGSCITAQRVRMWPHFSGHPHTQLKTTGNNIMSIEDRRESHLPTRSDSEQPSPRHGAWLRIIGLIVVVCLGVVVWRIYQNQKQSAANSASQSAALQSRPVPVQVIATEQKPMPIFQIGRASCR